MPDTPAVPPGSTEEEAQVLSPTAAHRAWSSPELRSMIIDHMAKEDIVKVLCLDQTAFKDMAKSLYRCFHFKNYDKLLSPSIPYTRRKLYIESIRKLDLEGATPLLCGIDGYSHLLDLFPLVNRITACDVELVTPSRHLVESRSRTSTATFYIRYLIASDGPSLPKNAHHVVLRIFPSCHVVHDIEEVEDEDEPDWTMSLWDLAATREALASPQSCLESRARGILEDIEPGGRLPMAAILCRRIRSIVLDLHNWEGLVQFSHHLNRRREAGYDDIPKIQISGIIDPYRYLLRLHPYIEDFNSSGDNGPTQSLSQLLLLEWDGEETTSSLALHHLVLYCDFEELDTISAEALLWTALRRRSTLCSFAKLKMLTLYCDKQTRRSHRTSIVSFSLVAKCLLQIGGTRFQFRAKSLTKSSHYWCRDGQMLRSQLENEVIRRQEKERRKPKYVKPDV